MRYPSFIPITHLFSLANNEIIGQHQCFYIHASVCNTIM